MSQIRIGWASRDISTTKPINILGQFHMRISKGILDPLTTTALVMDSGDDQVIFLSADAPVFRAGLQDMIREKVAKINPDIPVMKIVAGATHTHTAASHMRDDRPFGYGIENSSVSEKGFDYGMEVASSDEYREFMASSCADAIVEAWEKRAPAGYAYGYGYAVAAHSRRVCYFDDLSKRPGAVKNSLGGVNGKAAMYGNTNDDNVSHYEAGADHFVNLLYTYDAEGKLTGAIVNVPCPSQNSEGEYYLSADYWHDVRVAIREKHGDIFILPQCAAAGDLSPRILHYKKAQDRRFRLKYGDIDTKASAKNEICARKDIAERIAAAFDEVLAWASKDIHTEEKITHVVETVELSKRLISDEEYAYAKAEYEKEAAKPFVTEGTPEEMLYKNSTQQSMRNRFVQIIDRYELQKTEEKLPMEMHVVGIGDIAFASNRFELYMDYQHRIQARSPFEQTFIIQLAAQPGMTGGSYLCTERGFEGRGYSASMYCNQASPEGGQELVEETVRILKEIHQ